jgi:pimeloyl-ACP methyl ester carboxylesterase
VADKGLKGVALRQKNLKPFIGILILLLVLGLVALYYLSPDWMARSALALERFKAGLKKESLTTNNVRFVYLTGGKGPAMVLLHGFGGSKDNFTRMAARLSDDYKIIIPDLPGFGESTRNAAWNYAMPAQASRLHAFITALGIPSFHLAGNSMGGGIATEYAARHPERVKSLCLLAPAHVSSAPPSELFLMVENGKNPFFVKDLEDYSELMKMVFADLPFIPRPIRVYFAEQMRKDQKFLKQAMDDIIKTPYAVEKHICEYPGPVLAVWGDKDRILHPKGADILAEKTPRIQKAIIKDCGHLPMLEKPQQTARIYDEFLKKTR